ncbi:MAG TPA: hypothetical protein PLE74_01200 [Candidatus Cloacimonadota bacterium]|nr:hypothetical protein [Candidatus Cloacimonadota bacterium]
MKVNGKKIDGPSEVVIPVIRASGDIYFKAKAVLNFETFNALCPVPKPPMMQKPGEDAVAVLNDEKYLTKLGDFTRKRTAYMIIQSLSATENLEWETVKIDDSSTWLNYETELKNAGLSDIEIGRLINGVLEANGLDDQKVEEAKKRFLATQQVKV